MEEDGLEDSLSAAIVEVWGSGAQTPEGGGTRRPRADRGKFEPPYLHIRNLVLSEATI
jgi:hypothetical protein